MFSVLPGISAALILYKELHTEEAIQYSYQLLLPPWSAGPVLRPAAPCWAIASMVDRVVLHHMASPIRVGPVCHCWLEPEHDLIDALDLIFR